MIQERTPQVIVRLDEKTRSRLSATKRRYTDIISQNAICAHGIRIVLDKLESGELDPADIAGTPDDTSESSIPSAA